MIGRYVNSPVVRTSARLPRKAAMFCGLFLLAMLFQGAPALAACDFRQPLNNTLPLGTISPAQTGDVVARIELRFQCTQGDSPVFSLSGANDLGAGLHRMRNVTTPSEFLRYQTTTQVRARRLVINTRVTEADYRDAWVGPYEDTLTITVLP